MKSIRGRPPTDLGWAEITAKAERSLPSDGPFNENENMVEEWRSADRSWYGCSIHPNNFARAHESAWVCKIYLAGEQRVIGRGTLYQCARLYDAAQVHYAKYRTGKGAPTRFRMLIRCKKFPCYSPQLSYIGAPGNILIRCHYESF